MGGALLFITGQMDAELRKTLILPSFLFARFFIVVNTAELHLHG